MVGEIRRDSVRVQLSIEFTACVVPVRGHNPVPCRSVLIGAIHPNAGRCVVLRFCESRADSFVMCGDQPLVFAGDSLNRN